MNKRVEGAAHVISRNILSTTAVIMLMGVAAFAAAPTGGYLPGATLDPDCTAGDINCIVANVGTETDPLRKFVEGDTSIDAVFTGGNVGIGTDDPAALLELSSPTGAALMFDKSGTNLGYIGDAASANDDLYFTTYYTGSLKFLTDAYVSTLPDLMIDGMTGNVGIGTDNPLSTLDVRSSGTGTAIVVGNSNNTGGAIHLGNENHGIIRGGQDQYANNVTLYTGAGDINFATTTSPWGRPTNAHIKMTVKNDGKVGIGTLTPENKLHIDGNDGITMSWGGYAKKEIVHSAHDLSFKVGGTEKIRIPNMNGDLSQILGHDSQASYPTFSFIDDRNTGMLNMGSDKLGFNTAAINRLLIDDNGNIGIGTASPSGLLEVSKNGGVETWLKVRNNSGLGTAKSGISVGYADYAAMDIFRNGPSADIFFDANQGNGKVRFQDAGVDTLTISEGGNVGIGNNILPASRLDVNGNIKIGDEGTDCNASTEGQVRYENSSKKHQGCNGITWNNLY